MSKREKSNLSTIADKEKAKHKVESVFTDTEKLKLAYKLGIVKKEKTELADELVIAKKEKTELADELVIANAEKAKSDEELVIANEEKAELAAELVIADAEKADREYELVIANSEKADREDELVIANEEKAERATELVIANKEKAERAAELVVANEEKEKRAAELVIANEEKEKRAAELVIANAEKAKRAAELVIANAEKAKRAAVLAIANLEKEKRADELIIADKELTYQNEEKVKRAAELVIANIKKTKRDAELVIAKIEKAKRLAKSIIADKELSFQTKEKSKRATELVIADAEKAKREAELVIANIKKAKRSAELVIANVEKAKRAAELVIANKELVYQKSEKAKRAAELVITNKELVLATERAKLTSELILLNSALLESEEKFRSILENSADGIFITNQEGKYVYTNKEVSAMLGYSSEEMINKTIADISPANKIDEYFKLFGQILNKGRIFGELELLKKDGNYISTDLNAVLLPDGMIYGSCRDITERKRTEFELIKAKEKAEESDRLKSTFLTNMSHEIRTPMNGILGFAELLQEPNLTIEEQHNYIQTMQISGLRMLNTINSIVDMSKIESGLISVDIKETNLNEKIEFTYKFFKSEVENKGLQFLFKTSLPLKQAYIKTDNEKVYGILTNLVRNAIKFTYKGFIAFGYEKKSEYLEFFVKDTGTGIPQNQHELIFERFRQGSESHNRGYEGSGLGLSISKSYVEMLGGRIWVESEEGLGSTFYFTIPYNPVLVEKTEGVKDFSEVYEEVPLKNLKILIVEDDEISYSLLTRTIQKISKEVLHAITGLEAVEACRNNPDLDLVLMDIRMPQVNGLEATHQIRKFNKDVIIIAQTAYAFSGDSEKAIDAGCNDYISKPISKTLLYELIKKHCN